MYKGGQPKNAVVFPNNRGRPCTYMIKVDYFTILFKVPFSWCPPESLSRRQFSHQSDVWAFGVLLWELYTYGEEPWAGYRAADVLRMTESGERLKQPERASKELFDLMSMCWQLQPENRPKFSLLRQLLKEIRFTVAECRSDHPAESLTELALTSGDQVIIVNERYIFDS